MTSRAAFATALIFFVAQDFSFPRTASFQIDPTREELENIPSVSPVLAQRIIAARPFGSADDLRNVKGIGDKRYQKLRLFFE